MLLLTRTKSRGASASEDLAKHGSLTLGLSGEQGELRTW